MSEYREMPGQDLHNVIESRIEAVTLKVIHTLSMEHCVALCIRIQDGMLSQYNMIIFLGMII